jgi:hypothetical protein
MKNGPEETRETNRFDEETVCLVGGKRVSHQDRLIRDKFGTILVVQPGIGVWQGVAMDSLT